MVLHVDSDTLEADGSGLGRSELEDGTRVSAETSRRISCDCGVVRVTHGSSTLNVGRRKRTIPPALRRALETRDRGCRFPGCGSRFTDAHHVTHWADGGETSLDNCVLLCRHHHRLVHEGRWRVDWWGRGRPVFFDPRGVTHFEGRWEWPEGAGKGPSGIADPGWGKEVVKRPGRSGIRANVSAETSCRDNGSGGPASEGLAEALLAENRLRGVHPDAWTPSARWKREEEIPDEVLFRAGEAMRK